MPGRPCAHDCLCEILACSSLFDALRHRELSAEWSRSFHEACIHVQASDILAVIPEERIRVLCISVRIPDTGPGEEESDYWEQFRGGRPRPGALGRADHKTQSVFFLLERVCASCPAWRAAVDVPLTRLPALLKHLVFFRLPMLLRGFLAVPEARRAVNRCWLDGYSGDHPRSLLVDAVDHDHFDIAQQLLDARSDINVFCGHIGVTALYAACGSQEGPGATGKYAGCAGGSFYVAIGSQARAGFNPAMVRLLLERGADASWSDSMGQTVLMRAALFADSTESIHLLLNARADPTARESDHGCTALELALLLGRRDVATLLKAAMDTQMPQARP